MKTSHTFFRVAIVIALSSAEIDWDTVQAKYAEMDASWLEQAQKACEIMADEVDAETLKSASQALYTIHNRATGMNFIYAHEDTANKDLTVEKAKMYHDDILEQENLIHEVTFKPFKAMLKEETKRKLEGLFEDSQNYRIWKLQEIMELLAD